MKRQWSIRRELIEARDAQRRWDRAYQCLLRWASNAPSPVSGDQPMQEASHANRGICPSVNPTSGSDADH